MSNVRIERCRLVIADAYFTSLMQEKSLWLLRLFVLWWVIFPTLSQAQVSGIGSDTTSRFRFMIGGGSGLAIMTGLPKNIFRQPGLTGQVGLVVQYTLSARTSLVSGIEGWLAIYPSDAQWLLADQALRPVPAPDSVKYASLQTISLALPVGIRHYLIRRRNGALFYVQGNLTLQYFLQIDHRYRARNKLVENHWADSVNRITISPGIIVGMNNILRGRLSKLNGLLNAATFGLSVEVLPFRTFETNQRIVPLLLTTKFVF